MIHYICVELFQESSQTYLHERLANSKPADDAGDGIFRYALSFGGHRSRTNQAISYARKFGFGIQTFPEFPPDVVVITSNKVGIDNDLDVWFGERVHVCNSESREWNRLHIIRAKNRYREQLKKRLSDEFMILDTACRFLLRCEEYLLHY